MIEERLLRAWELHWENPAAQRALEAAQWAFDDARTWDGRPERVIECLMRCSNALRQLRLDAAGPQDEYDQLGMEL